MTELRLSQGQEFERALDSNPDDWDLRRVYGDWLEENGCENYCVAQRWMAEHKKRPLEKRNGFPTFAWGKQPGEKAGQAHHLSWTEPVWLWSREAAERWLAVQLANESKATGNPSSP